MILLKKSTSSLRRKRVLNLFFLVSINYSFLNAQQDSTNLDIASYITLDSFVVTASKNGFNIEDFIQMVQEDESFYIAFRNLRTESFTAFNDIKMYQKNNTLKTSYTSKTIQYYDGECRTMEYLDEETTGKFYKRKKNKKYKYYTAKMYDRLFFTHGKKCSKKDINANINLESESKGMEKYVSELKKLIFKPGKKVNIPIIGDKTAIFDKKMAKYYNYTISSNLYNDSIDCYVFTVQVKDEFQKNKKKTVIKNLETYFTKTDFQVIGRNYTLAYQGALFDFDIDIKIDLEKINDIYVPSFIQYDGWWKVPTKKLEKSKFTSHFSYE